MLIPVGARRHHIVALLVTEAVSGSTLTVRLRLLVLAVKFAESSFRD